jgi:hypothetical protein
MTPSTTYGEVVGSAGALPIACPGDARPPPGRQTMRPFDALAVAQHGGAQATGMTPWRGLSGVVFRRPPAASDIEATQRPDRPAKHVVAASEHLSGKEGIILVEVGLNVVPLDRS